MRSFLILVLISCPLLIFGQQFVKIQLADGTKYKGDIIEYTAKEFKLVQKRKVIIIQRDEIVSPKKVLINPKKYTTSIKVKNDDNWYQGSLIIENDTSIMLEIGKDLHVTFQKSDIVFRTNRAKKKGYVAETTIYTKDGNKFVGEVVDKNENFTMIDLGNKMPVQKINNENIESETEFYRNNTKALRKVLIVIAALYVIPSLLVI